MNEIGKNVYEGFVPTHPLDLQGWTINADIFERLIVQQRPNIILEVGTWKGKSAMMMADIVKALNLDCKIYCIDTWLGSLEFWEWLSSAKETDLNLTYGYPQIYYQFLSNVVHTNNQDIIIPVPLTSNIAAKLLTNKGITSQLIYVDGSHEEDDVYNDIKNYYKLLKPGGIIFGDDYWWDSVKNAVHKFVDEIEGHNNFSNEPANWILKKPEQP